MPNCTHNFNDFEILHHPHDTRQYAPARCAVARWCPADAFTTALREPLHGRAVWVLGLDPVTGPTGPIGRVDPLRHDALQAQAPRVLEHGGAVGLDMLIERQPTPNTRQ
jgi:hypothetical protein